MVENLNKYIFLNFNGPIQENWIHLSGAGPANVNLPIHIIKERNAIAFINRGSEKMPHDIPYTSTHYVFDSLPLLYYFLYCWGLNSFEVF